MNLKMPVMDPCYFCEIARQGIDGWNRLSNQNNGILSGQEVPHFHLHVVPRTAGSDWGVGAPHLARAQSATREAHRDHAVVTERKLESVRLLTRELQGSQGFG